MKNLTEYMQSFTVIGLVLFGITGFSYHLFKDDGWVELLVGNLWDASVQYPLIVIPIVVAAVFLGKMWSEGRTPMGRTSKVPNAFIYALMAAGAVFIGRWFLYGTL